MILTHNIAHNIPFISIFLAMFAGIITPLVNDGKKSCLIHTNCSGCYARKTIFYKKCAIVMIYTAVKG